MKKTDAISAGLAYMLAAQAALPRTLGDRERVEALSNCMRIAVDNRFAFKVEDAKALNELNIRRCVGVFRALNPSYYHTACLKGGTYARLYEAWAEFSPWRAAVAVFRTMSSSAHVLEDNRVTEDVGVLMPDSFGADEPDLATHQGLQVWWVTAYTDETINLCRYKPAMGYEGHLRRPGGAPARRRQISRQAWDKYQAEAKEAWAARANPGGRPVFVDAALAA